MHKSTCQKTAEELREEIDSLHAQIEDVKDERRNLDRQLRYAKYLLAKVEAEDKGD